SRYCSSIQVFRVMMPHLTSSLSLSCDLLCFFFFTDPATTDIYPLSLHDALPISSPRPPAPCATITSRPSIMPTSPMRVFAISLRSEEHTSELQSRENLVCRLLLEKKKQDKQELLGRAQHTSRTR